VDVVSLFVSWLLPSNRSTHYTAPQIAYRHTTISSFLGAVLVTSVISPPTAPSLRLLVPSGSMIRCQSVQLYHHHLPLVGVGKSSRTDQCSYGYGSSAVSSLFFCFGGASPLHNVLMPIFHSLIENSTTHFTTSSPIICPRALLNALWLPGHSCRLVPQSFSPLLHFGHGCRLLSSIHLSGAPLAALSLPGP
jgi:hypothetical protein